MKSVLFLVGIILTCSNMFSQFQFASEKIIQKPKDIIDTRNIINYIVGKDDDKIIFSVDYFKNNCYETKEILYFDEIRNEVTKKTEVSINKEFGLVGVKQFNNLKLHTVYKKNQHNNFSFCEILDFHQLNLSYLVNRNDFILKNTNNFEEGVDLMISFDGRYVIYSPYTGEYLQDVPNDSTISIYDFGTNEEVKPIQKKITCQECIKPQMANGKLYYSKKFYYFPGTDAYDWKIFRATNFDRSKTELLAEYIEILLVSPDGNYILGKKNLHGKDVAVLLDVDAKKFNYLLGRDYLQYDYFFSPAHKKFAFDTENYFIYIEYPTKFPFGSVGIDAERIKSSISEKEAFWGNFSIQNYKIIVCFCKNAERHEVK